MSMSLFRPAVLRHTLCRAAPIAPRCVVPLRAYSVPSHPLLKEASAAKATKTKESKPKAKPKEKKEKDASKTTKAAKPKPKAAAESSKKDAPQKKTPKPLPDHISLPPKGPNTAYTLFFVDYYKDNIEDFRKENGKVDAMRMAQNCGSAWLELPDEKKAHYTKIAGGLKEEFNIKYAEWFNAYTHDERRLVEKFTGKKLHYPQGKLNYLNEVKNRPGNPGKPSSSYFEFLKSKRPEVSQSSELEGLTGLPAQMKITTLISAQWNALPQSEKDEWKRIYQERKAKYREWAEGEGLPFAKS